MMAVPGSAGGPDGLPLAEPAAHADAKSPDAAATGSPGTAAAAAGAEAGPAAANLAVVDILDRDGQVRQTHPVRAWPLRVGRSLDNDLVLSDPHVAARHFVLGPSEGDDLVLSVGETRNGVSLGRQRLRQGERHPFGQREALGGKAALPTELTVGRTRLRLHLPGDALEPELPLEASRPLGRRLVPIVAAAAVLLVMQLFSTYLSTDADSLGRAVGATLMTALGGAVVWCGAWSLLSKTFTRQAHFGWHLRVFLFASIGLLLLGVLPPALAFAFSWPAATDFAFVATFIVGGVAVYYHLLAVEPARPRLLRAVVAAGVLTGIGLTLVLNRSRTDLWGDELYMSHLFPPAMRLARPVPPERFLADLAALKPVLDKKAKETDTSDPEPSVSGDGEGDE